MEDLAGVEHDEVADCDPAYSEMCCTNTVQYQLTQGIRPLADVLKRLQLCRGRLFESPSRQTALCRGTHFLGGDGLNPCDPVPGFAASAGASQRRARSD
jgi:hypothetical protein